MSLPPINVMIAEDYDLYREGLREIMNDISGVVVTGVAPNGSNLLALVAINPPDIVVTDIRMPVTDGIEVANRLRETYPQIGVIALTMYDDEHFLIQMLAAGARGYVSKECTEEEFACAITEVVAGRRYYCPYTQERIAAIMGDDRVLRVFGAQPGSLFSAKELEIIRLTCEGCQDKDIAKALSLTAGTIKKYRFQLIARTGSKAWAGVVKYAVKHQLINIDSGSQS